VKAEDQKKGGDATMFYCPQCDRAVAEPLCCGDCGSLICRECGAALEQVDELGIG